MNKLDFATNQRESTLIEFYKASGFLLGYLISKEKYFKRTIEYYNLKGAGNYPVDLKLIVKTYCRIIEWTNLLSLKDEVVKEAIKTVFSIINKNIDNPTPEEYIKKYLTIHTMSSAIEVI